MIWPLRPLALKTRPLLPGKVTSEHRITDPARATFHFDPLTGRSLGSPHSAHAFEDALQRELLRLGGDGAVVQVNIRAVHPWWRWGRATGLVTLTPRALTPQERVSLELDSAC